MATVLVVDDELSIRRMLGYVLSKTQYEVLMAADAQEALEKLAEHPVNVILLDVAMPNMDGITLLQQLRMMPPYHKLPIIMLTASTDELKRARALDAGADLYLNKFVKPSELVKLIDQTLQKSG
ncbi:MAG TPA: response regulator [Anaerolineae bacterium]|nr:response regulator [Anaerolineae bacterium]HQI85417.1 response regulator [Anaerolineae bacterium]HQK14796.1 response regulator [Anaerolineae bacterium]